MKHKGFLIFVTAIFSLLATGVSFAQINDPCGCNAGLAREVRKYERDSRISLAYLQQIDEKQFEKIKKDGATDGAFFDIIRASANYSDFQERRHEYLSKVNFSLNGEQSSTVLLETVKTGDWASCKKACIADQRGFNCGLFDLTSNTAAVRCSWRPEGADTKRRVSVVANGKDLSPKLIDPNTTKDWQFQRNPSSDLLLTFELEDRSSSSVKIAATPKAHPPIKKRLQIASCIGRGGVEGVHFWGPQGELCNGIKEWGPYAAGALTPTRICRCTGHGGVEGLGLWGPEGETCAGIPAWGKYSQDCQTLGKVCGCMGKGDKIGGHIIWGPQGTTCGNIPPWGTYAQFCTDQ